MLNYDIQGIAHTLMMIIDGLMFRKSLTTDTYLLINTIHDSVMSDCKPEGVEVFIQHAKEAESELIPYIRDNFGYIWKLPISLEIKQGSDWFTCK